MLARVFILLLLCCRLVHSISLRLDDDSTEETGRSTRNARTELWDSELDARNTFTEYILIRRHNCDVHCDRKVCIAKSDEIKMSLH